MMYDTHCAVEMVIARVVYDIWYTMIVDTEYIKLHACMVCIAVYHTVCAL